MGELISITRPLAKRGLKVPDWTRVVTMTTSAPITCDPKTVEISQLVERGLAVQVLTNDLTGEQSVLNLNTVLAHYRPMPSTEDIYQRGSVTNYVPIDPIVIVDS